MNIIHSRQSGRQASLPSVVPRSVKRKDWAAASGLVLRLCVDSGPRASSFMCRLHGPSGVCSALVSLLVVVWLARPARYQIERRARAGSEAPMSSPPICSTPSLATADATAFVGFQQQTAASARSKLELA